MHNTFRSISLTVITVATAGTVALVGLFTAFQTDAQRAQPLRGYTITYYGQTIHNNVRVEVGNAGRIMGTAPRKGATVETMNRNSWNGEKPQSDNFFIVKDPQGKFSMVDDGPDYKDLYKMVVEEDSEPEEQPGEEVQDPGQQQPGGDQQQNGQQQPDLPQGHGEVCVVVAAGWASENEYGQVYDGKDGLPSIPDGEEKYGECVEDPPTILSPEMPDCPYKNWMTEFEHQKGGDLNFRLFHDRDVTLGENVRTAKEQHGTGENVTYWIPNKQQAQDFANNGFKYYNINGQQVSPGPKQTDRRSITDPVTGDTYAVRQGCTFMEAMPDPSMPGSGGGQGGGQEGGGMDKLLEFLTSLAQSLAGNGGGGQQDRPTPDPERESQSPLIDPETRQIIDAELDQISALDLPTNVLDRITEAVMNIILRVRYGEFALPNVFSP